MGKVKVKKNRASRKERRFFPESTANPLVLRVLGAVGVAALGAGAYEQFLTTAPEPFKYTPWLLAGGAALFGLSIWFGTSGDPVVRVGDGGIGVERGNTRRIPWHELKELDWDGEKKALRAKGRDEDGKDLTIVVKLKTQAQAAAWMLKEGQARVPDVVHVPEDVAEPIGAARETEGHVVPLDPLQVAGKKCMESGKSIVHEEDGLVCPKCERIYHKNHLPKKCACGVSLAELRGTARSA